MIAQSPEPIQTVDSRFARGIALRQGNGASRLQFPRAARTPKMDLKSTGISHTVYPYSPQSAARSRPIFDHSDMHFFELDFHFCANPQCELHVRAGDPGVHGFGNWAQLPDGRIIGRSFHRDGFLCDTCCRTAAASKPIQGDHLSAA